MGLFGPLVGDEQLHISVISRMTFAADFPRKIGRIIII